MKTNIAERLKERYESKDFREDHITYLFESFANNKAEIVNRMIDYFNVSNYETQRELSNWFVINREQAKLIYNFIEENFESFTQNYNGYYVGYTSLESIEFGEQEEQLTGLYNHSTMQPYNLAYLKKAFDKAGYTVNKNGYAYYIVSGGLHVDLLANVQALNDFLATIK